MRYEREDENARIHNVHPVFHPLELKSVSRTMKKQGCAICILVPTSEFFPPSFIFLSCLRLSHLIKQHSLQYLAYSPLATDSPHQHKSYCTLYAFLQVTRKTNTNMLQVLWHGPCNASNWIFSTQERVEICACMSCGFLLRIRNSTNDILEFAGRRPAIISSHCVIHEIRQQR